MYSQSLEEMTSSFSGNSWLMHVLKQIEVLKFACDWQAKTGPGSKNEKAKFYRTMFALQSDVQAVFSHLSDKEIGRLIKEKYADDFKLWKRRNEGFVTARNRLLTMYNLVRFVCTTWDIVLTVIIQFGASVLIDPVWSVDDLATRRSRSFMAVMMQVIEEIEEEGTLADMLSPLHKDSSRVLLDIIDSLLDRAGAMGHVRDFLRTTPPSYELIL